MKFTALILSSLVSASAFALGAQAPNEADIGKIQCVAKPLYSSRPSHSNAPVKGRPMETQALARNSAKNRCRAARARSCHVVACFVVGALSAEDMASLQ
jgi:hypothetical protein